MKANTEKKHETEGMRADPLVVLREEFDEWAILFHPETAAAIGINPTAVSIWKRLDGKHSPEKIVGHIRAEFDAVPENVQEDVLEFLELLKEYGMAG